MEYYVKRTDKSYNNVLKCNVLKCKAQLSAGASLHSPSPHGERLSNQSFFCLEVATLADMLHLLT